MDSTTGAPPPLRLRVLETVFRLEPRYWGTYHLLRRDWARCVVEGGDSVEDVPFDLPNEFDPLPEGFSYGLASQLTGRGITALAGRYLMFHAAGLSDQRGRALALIGASGAGKTTAARLLASAGWGYLTDEALAVADDGRVVPYPKPLSLVGDPLNPYSKRQVGPDELGLGPTSGEPVLASLVILDRVRDRHIQPEITEVRLLDALLELIPQTSALARLEAPLRRLCGLAQRVGVHRLTYSEVDDAATLLAGLPDRPAATPEAWEPLEDPPSGPGPTGTWTPAHLGDAIRIGGEGLVLLDRTPVRLSPLGLTIFQRCWTGAEEEELVKAAELTHGYHPEAARMVHAALAAMSAAGLLLKN